MTGEERVRVEATTLDQEMVENLRTLKMTFAAVSDLVKEHELAHLKQARVNSLEALRCLEKAQERIEEACMWAVKGITTP